MFLVRTEIRKIKFICEMDEDIPKEFCTDARRLKQILINLTANAIKFTFSGSIGILAKCVTVKG